MSSAVRIISSIRDGKIISQISQHFSKHYHKGTLFLEPLPEDASKLTTADLVDIFAKEVGHAKEYSKRGMLETLRQRESLMNLLPQSVDELPPRRMKDSLVSAIIPLKDKLDIREKYVTFDGSVRIGRVLEDMDIFSVFCAFKHISNPKSAGQKNPYSVVTALVDSIHVSDERMRNNEDIRMTGHVTYVGRSSIEVSLVLDQVYGGSHHKLLDAVFLMVARDPMNTGPALINPLVGDTEEEKLFIDKGKQRQAVRKSQALESLGKNPPTEEERYLIHNMFIQQLDTTHAPLLGASPSGPKGKEVNMDETALKTLFICHPEHRNRYNKIFGGFLMRQATELAFTSTLLYTKSRPRLVYIDDIVFRRPVEIGSILRYNSHIGYVEGRYLHCPVSAEVITPKTGETQVSNVFQFTFKVDDSAGEISPLKFTTYQEAILYLDSRRYFNKMMSHQQVP